MINKFLEKKSAYFYFAFRIIIGLLFMLHGIQKLPGIFNGNTAIFSLIALAALIEVIGGLFLVIGLLTRYISLISAIEMLFAYFMAHASNGLSPLANRGEAAVLFFAAFLVMAGFGSGKWAIGNLKR